MHGLVHGLVHGLHHGCVCILLRQNQRLEGINIVR